MAQTFGQNASGDVYIGPDGNLVILSGLPAVEAACATASRAQLGEEVLTTGNGLPNFQAVWVGAPNIPLWQSYLRNTLQNVEGVRQVTNITVQQTGSKLGYTAAIQTQYGQGAVNA